MKEDWFHGDITREESDSKLSDFEKKRNVFSEIIYEKFKGESFHFINGE